MAIELGIIEATLSGVLGDDPTLLAQLKSAFLEGARRQVDLLERSRCDANWQFAAWRLRGLAASFGAVDIMNSAKEAAEGAPGDPVVIREIKALLQEFDDGEPIAPVEHKSIYRNKFE